MAGLRVWKGLAPGRRRFGPPAPRLKLHPLFCQMTPVRGRTRPEPNSK